MRIAAIFGALAWAMLASARAEESALNLGSRRELFVDGHLIDVLHGVSLNLCEPRDEGPVVLFDQPWEGPFCGYCTVLRDGQKYLLYYRGKPTSKADGSGEVTCLAESFDGMKWTKPKLEEFEFAGRRDANIVLATDGLSHNFSPFLDANPAAPAESRFKALAGTMATGLVTLVSSDGRQWRKLQEEPVLSKNVVPFPYMFDSQNVAFYSLEERKYLAYFRVFQDKVRRICRAESDDFVHWRQVQLMEYHGMDGEPAPIEHLYTNQTHPYFRAPHHLCRGLRPLYARPAGIEPRRGESD